MNVGHRRGGVGGGGWVRFGRPTYQKQSSLQFDAWTGNLRSRQVQAKRPTFAKCNVDRADQGEPQGGKADHKSTNKIAAPKAWRSAYCILYMEHNRTLKIRGGPWKLTAVQSRFHFAFLPTFRNELFLLSALCAPVFPVPRCVPAAEHAENYIIRKMKLVTCQGRRLLGLPRPLTDCFASHNWPECAGRAGDTQPNQLTSTCPANVRVGALFH